jgi:hypothetical protein
MLRPNLFTQRKLANRFNSLSESFPEVSNTIELVLFKHVSGDILVILLGK